jgi:EAL domain-containing protein (putative c-di-GMP-specific phosphodiesterase class I)
MNPPGITPSRIHLPKGGVLFADGDQPSSAYLVESGEIEISTMVRGRRMVLSRLGAGELLGEMAVFDTGPRSATATACTDSVLYVIDPEQVSERLAKTDPVIRALIESLLRRYRGMLETYRLAEPRWGAQAEVPSFERVHADAIVYAEGDPSVHPTGVGKLRLESQLREALAHEGLDVRYQPILDIAGHCVAGYEALIRWNHPVRGPVSPLELVGLAEESALIVQVGEYVFDTACAAVRRLVEAGAQPPPFIAVNVSARQLEHPGLIERVVARVDAAAVPRGSLKIEFTESQLLDEGLVEQAIDLCHRHGIGVALDDFGTGYSHLTQMHRLHFDTLKIDQGFTQALLGEPRARAVVEAIVAMARALGAQIVAEGVESEETLAVLRALGCDFAQGYLIGEAQPLEAILAGLRAR